MTRTTKQSEEEVRQTVRSYLWSDTARWALREGTATFEWRYGEGQLDRLAEIAEVIGQERVRELWAEVRREVREEMAEMARLVAPDSVVEEWLRSDTDSVIDWAALEPSLFLDSPQALPNASQAENEPEEQVREAVGRVMRAGFLPEALHPG